MAASSITLEVRENVRENINIPPCEEALSFEPEEFALVYNLVARRSKDLSARRKVGSRVTGGDDEAVTVRARGALLSDAFAPVRERYKSDPLKYHSAVHRMTALAKIIKSLGLSGWTRVKAEGIAVDKAVLAAAATVPLEASCEFPVMEFLQEVVRYASATESS